MRRLVHTSKVDDSLRYAASEVSDLSLREYRVSFRLLACADITDD